MPVTIATVAFVFAARRRSSSASTASCCSAPPATDAAEQHSQLRPGRPRAIGFSLPPLVVHGPRSSSRSPRTIILAVIPTQTLERIWPTLLDPARLSDRYRTPRLAEIDSPSTTHVAAAIADDDDLLSLLAEYAASNFPVTLSPPSIDRVLAATLPRSAPFYRSIDDNAARHRPFRGPGDWVPLADKPILDTLDHQEHQDRRRLPPERRRPSSRCRSAAAIVGPIRSAWSSWPRRPGSLLKLDHYVRRRQGVSSDRFVAHVATTNARTTSPFRLDRTIHRRGARRHRHAPLDPSDPEEPPAGSTLLVGDGKAVGASAPALEIATAQPARHRVEGDAVDDGSTLVAAVPASSCPSCPPRRWPTWTANRVACSPASVALSAGPRADEDQPRSAGSRSSRRPRRPGQDRLRTASRGRGRQCPRTGRPPRRRQDHLSTLAQLHARPGVDHLGAHVGDARSVLGAR